LINIFILIHCLRVCGGDWYFHKIIKEILAENCLSVGFCSNELGAVVDGLRARKKGVAYIMIIKNKNRPDFLDIRFLGLHGLQV
jgi:hypothetical protein